MRERKGQGVFLPLCFCAATRRSCKTGAERLTFGTAKRVRMGRIGVEDLHDFRRGLGKVYPKNKPLKVRSILTFYFRISPNF